MKRVGEADERPAKMLHRQRPLSSGYSVPIYCQFKRYIPNILYKYPRFTHQFSQYIYITGAYNSHTFFRIEHTNYNWFFSDIGCIRMPIEMVSSAFPCGRRLELNVSVIILPASLEFTLRKSNVVVLDTWLSFHFSWLVETLSFYSKHYIIPTSCCYWDDR